MANQPHFRNGPSKLPSSAM